MTHKKDGGREHNFQGKALRSIKFMCLRDSHEATSSRSGGWRSGVEGRGQVSGPGVQVLGVEALRWVPQKRMFGIEAKRRERSS